jgi:hypothetical protein
MLTTKQMHEQLESLLTDLRTNLDPQRRQTALDAVLQPFKPGGPYAYVPAKEGRIPAEKRWKAQEDRRAGHAVYGVDRTVMDYEPTIAARKQAARRPPRAEQNVRQRAGLVGLDLQTAELVNIREGLDELRWTPRLQNARPSRVLAEYQRALQDPTEAENTTIIRLVEELHGDGWAGTDPEEAELPKAMELQRAIAAAQTARIPADIHNIEALIAQAKAETQRVKTLRHITPMNPAIPALPQDE